MSESVFEQIRRMAESLSMVDRVALIEELTHSLGHESADERHTKPRSLRGAWRGRFREDFDLDSALHEIRTEWEKELVDIDPVPPKKEGAEGR